MLRHCYSHPHPQQISFSLFSSTTTTSTLYINLRNNSCSSSASLFSKFSFNSFERSIPKFDLHPVNTIQYRSFMTSQSSETPFHFEKPEKLRPFGPTVWHEFTPLAQKYNAVNLGQGFPNFSGPQYILDAAKKAIDDGLNQYTRSQGHPRLVNALSKFYSPLFERQIDGQKEIIVTVGASEALYSTIAALTNPGDEVILVEPYFDIYYGATKMNGAVPRYISMKRDTSSSSSSSSSGWILDPKDIEAVLTPRSRLLILNSPQNPTGKVFSRQELEAIAEVVKKHPNLVVISDEVYEFMTFDGVNHTRMASIPGMFPRTVTISSSGKTFSSTGWKIGWCMGPENLIATIGLVHSYIPFSVSTPMQEAVAVGFEEVEARGYFQEFRAMYEKKRDKLVKVLIEADMNPIIPEGSFFILADISKIQPKNKEGKEIDLKKLAKEVSITGTELEVLDYNIARWFTSQVGVAVIPVSAFVSPENQHKFPYVRLCFCKTDPVLEEACTRLSALKLKK